MKELIKLLKKDKQFRESWNANIAMAYKDNWVWHQNKTGRTTMNKKDRHIIANNAAEYFTKLICDELHFPEGH